MIFPKITLQGEGKTLQRLDIHWPFSEGLTEEITLNFDANRDGVLDEKELEELLLVWEEELLQNRFYTLLWLNGEEITTPIGINRTFNVLGNTSEYRFELPLDRPLRPGDVLEVRFFESTGALSFFFDRQSIHQNSVGDWSLSHNLHTFPHTLKLTFTQAAGLKGSSTQSETTALRGSAKERLAVDQAAQAIPAESKNPLSSWLSEQLASAFTLLRGYLHELKDNPSGAAFWGLMAFSFLYGLLHAAGPGHGKTLVMTYFFSTGGGWKKAGLMAFLIGAVHVFSALILTAILLFVLTVVFSAALDESSTLLTKLSGLLIVLIATHLFWRNLRRKYPKATKFTTTPTHTHDRTCGCASCGEAGRSSDLALVLAASIIPCPGTVTIFLFALSLGLYLTGFAAALAMSVGMGLIIFLAAGFGSTLRKATGGALGRSMRIFELIGAGIIMTLGFWLLLA